MVIATGTKKPAWFVQAGFIMIYLQHYTIARRVPEGYRWPYCDNDVICFMMQN